MKTRYLLSMLIAVLLLSGCSQGTPEDSGTNDTSSTVSTEEEQTDTTIAANASVSLSNNAELGEYLVDVDGMTLYVFAKDPNGQSACAGECLKNWPIFHSEDMTAGEGIDAADLGEVTGTDGTKQTTYKGWPLYYFAKDAAAGETNGEGVGEIWFVAKPDYDILIGTKGDAKYLTDASGNTLYRFTTDTADKSNCVGPCIENWPVFDASDVVAPSTVDNSLFGSITGAGGKIQTTFKSQPLYYYVKDAKRGDTNGDGVGGVWFLVDPAK